MVELMKDYNGMIEKEDNLYKGIQVCEECTDNILDYIAEKADSLHILTAEAILSAIHVIMKDLQTELLHLRIEKNILSREISRLREM
ncbi:hypothetical protein [Paenibacillus sp. YN15]|uniref:hypothetical protein n=1 Tax=Paenibacillus sp. YN15 TaxID=1742774 RepID=UPI000DCC9FF3|nr:hypothetical protein [Paenibacillus sp. YN15]RAV02667.1 hypothetical protein DQG13_09170 [Paenibacillus sp. YN15]